MKITVFGAAGKTGLPILEQALAAGHTVTAFVRDASKLPVSHAQLKVVQGDVRDATKVEEAVSGSEAVLSVLGQTNPPTPGLLVASVNNIVAAMKKHHVKRFVYLTGAGVRDPKDPPAWVRTLIVGLMKLISPAVLEDSENAYSIVTASDLEWVVVRVPILSEEPSKGDLHAEYVPSGPVRVSRVDVAKFMLAQISESATLKRSPFTNY